EERAGCKAALAFGLLRGQAGAGSANADARTEREEHAPARTHGDPLAAFDHLDAGERLPHRGLAARTRSAARCSTSGLAPAPKPCRRANSSSRAERSAKSVRPVNLSRMSLQRMGFAG